MNTRTRKRGNNLFPLLHSFCYILQDPLRGSPATLHNAKAETNEPEHHSQQEKHKHHVTRH